MECISIMTSALIFVIVVIAVRVRRGISSLDALPGPRSYPIIGNLLDVSGPGEKMMQRVIEREKRYGSIYRLWLGPIPVVNVSSPDIFEVILNNSRHLKKGFMYKFLHPWLGTGLLTSAGHKWFKHRKIITPTFHFKILDTFLDVFNENCEILVNKLREKAETGDVFDVYPFITLCALDIICETAMGTKVYAQHQIQSSYIKAIYRISSLTVRRCCKFWLHPDSVYRNTSEGIEYKGQLKILHDFTDRVIKERKYLRRRRRESLIPEEELAIGRTKKRRAFLDLLLQELGDEEENSKMTDKEIREEVDTFMFEGHDTSTAGMCWAILLLGSHQEIQDKAYEELRRIFQNDSERPPTMRDLNEMKYLERVIKEVLRLYPSVPMIARILDGDIQYGEYNIPAGTTIMMHVYNLHRNPDIFPDPEKFDPDRFLPEKCFKRHPYSYLPFSAGPRNCIGQKFALLEEKVILSTLLRNYKITSVQPAEKITLMNELILRPKNGIPIKISPRESVK